MSGTYNGDRFNAAMKRREAIMQRRRQIWELANGRVLSCAELAELSGQTPKEAYDAAGRLQIHALEWAMTHNRVRRARLAVGKEKEGRKA